jgi:peptidyl-prolyl cis-trans isomerase A (cyclophilin A)
MKQLLTIMFLCGATFAQTKATTAAKKSPAPARSLLDPSTMKAKAPETYKVKFVTTQGEVIIQVTRAWAPIGADRFYNLVRGGFYNGAAFFRVIPGFMAQFGINPDPKVSAVWMNQNIVDDPVKESNKRAYVTFAKASAPNTRGTQVFINYKANDFLDGQGFAPFGEVIEGMENVDKFYAGYGGNPDQGALQQLGKSWIDKNMPKIDLIKSAIIVPVAPPPAATKSTTAKAPAAKSTAAKSTAAKSTTTTKQ